ncbi:MAG: NADPH:quinone reductase [Cytophaga sp.]|nr:NADPH:quinone reductase [Undibacterium sp.]
MKAAWYDKFGMPSDVIKVGDFNKPAPAHGEVLIRMKTSGVNPSDTKKRAGAFPDLLDNGPVIPNSDGAGIIEAVGLGVPQHRIGQRVWVYQAQYGRLHGTAAEYLAIDSCRAVRLPDNVGFDVGACMGIPAMTAHRCVNADGSVQGQFVLVTGGAGRVGYYAIQFAKAAGATVIATAGNDEARRDCIAAGADFLVNHQNSDWEQQVLKISNGRKMDRVIEVDFGANLRKLLDIIRIGGVIATYSSTIPEPILPFRRILFMDLTIRTVIVYAIPEEAKAAAIRDITTALERCELQHRIAATYPLEQFAESNKKIEKAGFYGCVIVTIE